MKRIVFMIVPLFLVLGVFAESGWSSGDAIVIGRITGTVQELPGYFKNNSRLMARGINYVELPGFGLIRDGDGSRYLIRPDHNGFFYQELPEGKYTLSRKRNDRPDHRLPRMIGILEFEVEPGTLMNLGSIDIVLEGRPEENLRLYQNSAKGTYIYRYRYQRVPGDMAYSSPLRWFRGKKPKIAAAFRGRIDRESAVPTGVEDGSRVYLREPRRIVDR